MGSTLETGRVPMISSILEQIPLSVRQRIAIALPMCFNDIHSAENAGQLCVIVEEVKSYLCGM